MRIGVPKEIKNQEHRVGATPAMVDAFVRAGHQVRVQEEAGGRIGFSNEMYREAGAEIVATAKEVYQADMIIKVKEPQESEFSLLRRGQILFCYLHLAPDPIQTKQLLEKGVIGIAYETVTDRQGRLPLLEPMSEIAGRLSIQVGAAALQLNNGGKGILLGGVPGVLPGKVMIIGGGASGTEAARMACGVGADVVVLDVDVRRLKKLDALFGPRLKTVYSSALAIEELIPSMDLVIGAVLIHGKKAPCLVTHQMVKKMKPGSAIVDIAIDQGGCIETSRPTTHDDPTYTVSGVVHYCVTNMPGACARTSTMALTNATMHDALRIADLGVKEALLTDPHLKNGLNVALGHVTCAAVAHDLGYPYTPPDTLLNQL